MKAAITATRLVQRCACGAKSGGECESCRKKKHLQRKSRVTQGADPGVAFHASPRLTEGGMPLPAKVQRDLSPLYGASFGAVRLHDDAASHAAALEVNARAFTLGQHIHFGAGEFRPQEREGRALLAHELTHTMQQRGVTEEVGAPVVIDPPDSAREHEADEAATRVSRGERASWSPGGGAQQAPGPRGIPVRRLVQRVGLGEFFVRLFGEGTFSDQELLAYLKYLDDHAAIEGDYDSDNKARAIISRWRAGDPKFLPTLPQKQLMLLELIDGPTLDADEHAILELLRGSSDAEVVSLLATAGGDDALRDEFHGSEADELDAFLAEWHKKPAHRAISTEEVVDKRIAIDEVVVNQTTPQVVTVRYRDGRVEADTCSAGKGTCCIDPGARGGPSAAATQLDDSNWTPIGAHRVQFKQKDHDGIRWWTQFNSRAIALHEYSPVDGTPLSHGCVRLHGDFARRIYEGARPGRTVVRVVGIPLPRCDHGPLRNEWDNDFSSASTPPRDGEGKALRRHLSIAFGHPGDKVLDQRIAEGRVPRCGAGRNVRGTP